MANLPNGLVASSALLDLKGGVPSLRLEITMPNWGNLITLFKQYPPGRMPGSTAGGTPAATTEV